MNRAGNDKRKRRGVTLIELLVVVGIMLALAAIAVPAMRPVLETRRVREAARVVNLYLNSARNRALATGHSVGVMIERDPTLPQGSAILRQVEVPPPYAGDTTGAMVKVAAVSGAANPVIKIAIRKTDFANNLIRRLDKIQLNCQGPIYTIIADPSGSPNPPDFPLDPPTAQPGQRQYIKLFDPQNYSDTDNDGFVDNFLLTAVALKQNAIPPWPVFDPTATTGNPQRWSQAVPFVITRLPEPTSTPPLQLPQQTAIDLVWSGTSSQQFFTTGSVANPDLAPVVLMFSSSGSLKDYYFWSLDNDAISPIYLLIGRRDRVPLEVFSSGAGSFTSPAEDGLTNLQDLNNSWVVIQPQTGLITTSEVAENANDVVAARKFAREAQAMGGR